MEQNKKTVQAFYDAVLNKKDFEEASKYLGPATPSTIRSPPTARRASRASSPSSRTSSRTTSSEIKRIFADGDYVIVHVHAVREPGTRGNAIIDIFKLENGKVVEHWDAVQPIPEKSDNNNGMF